MHGELCRLALGRVLNGLLSDNTRKNNNKNSYIERVGMANAKERCGLISAHLVCRSIKNFMDR